MLELRSGQYRLGETLRGYQTPGGGTCVDFVDLIQAMDLPIRLDRKSRRATGWIFSESETFTLDREAGMVQTMNDKVALADNAIRDTPEGWCIDTKQLSSWFGVIFRPDISNLSLIIHTERKLPFLQAIERRSRAAQLDKAASAFDLAQLPKAEIPYKTWRAPSVDVMIRTVWRSAASRPDLQYEVFASGEALGASVDARLASDNTGTPDTLRVRAYRIDPNAGLLGPLGATQVAAGDVETYAGALTGQSAVGRGIFLTNRPIIQPSRFAVTSLRGTLPAGWDAELYRNGQLLSFQADRSDGRYEFPDVELHFGRNVLEVVLYGPQGQVRRERSEIPVGTEGIPVGKTWYWGGLIEQNRDLIDFHRSFADPLTGWRWGVGVERGIDKRTAFGLEAQSFLLEGRRQNYLEASLTRALGPMLFELAGSKQFGQGTAIKANGLGRIGGISVHAEALWVNGGYRSELVSANDRRFYGLRLESQLKLGGARIPVQLGMRQTLRRDGEKVTEWLTRLSMVMRGVMLTSEVSHQRTSGSRFGASDDGSTLRLLANGHIGPVRLRGEMSYRLTGLQRGIKSAILSGEGRLSDRTDLRGSVEYHGDSGRTDFTLGMVRQFRRFALRADAKAATNGEVGGALALSFSLGRNPGSGRWRMSSEKLAQNGMASVEVFRDENGDGLRQPGEDGVPGVGVLAGFRQSERTTDTSGHTLVEGLRPFMPVVISIDSSSVEDPLLQPKGKGMVVVPRPGVGSVMSLALAPTGEVEGMLLAPDGTPREGARLELIDARGLVVKQTLSEFDGYFLFDTVPYGQYRLRLSPETQRTLGVAAISVAVNIGRALPSQRLDAIRLEAAASSKPVLATRQ